MIIKRFLVFCWLYDRPSGGFDDLMGSADTIDEAMGIRRAERDLFADKYSLELMRTQIVDTKTGWILNKTGNEI